MQRPIGGFVVKKGAPRFGGLLTHHAPWSPVWHRERACRLARSGASLAGAIFTPTQPPLLVNSQMRRQI